MKGNLIHLLGGPNWRFCHGQGCKIKSEIDFVWKQSLSYNASNFLLLQLIFVLSANLSIIFSIKHLYNNMPENSKKY